VPPGDPVRRGRPSGGPRLSLRKALHTYGLRIRRHRIPGSARALPWSLGIALGDPKREAA
jgi:hypothetical protein